MPGLPKAADVMRIMKYTLLILVILISINCTAQKKPKDYQWPGFVRLNDSVFISLKEISVSNYNEAVMLMKPLLGSNSRLPDLIPNPETVDWFGYSPFLKYAFSIDTLVKIVTLNSHKSRKVHEVSDSPDVSLSFLAYVMDLPIVNVTKAQALLYCDIRGKGYSILKQNTKRKKGWNLPDSVVFRLPTVEEWTTAFGDPFSVESDLSLSDANLKGGVVCRNLWETQNTGEYRPLAIHEGYYNLRNVFNLCGNVSELLQDSDDAYGGSYSESIRLCSPDLKSGFNPPHSSIGFRVVAVIKR